MTVTSTRPVDGTAVRTAEALADLDNPCYVVRTAAGIAVTGQPPRGDGELLAAVGPLPPARLGGASGFVAAHGVAYPYMAGAMANGIASEELVIALARVGCLASFGAAGLLPERIEAALRRFDAEISGLPRACNLIHSPSESGLERAAVQLFLTHGVDRVEASAFMDLTPHVVRYRVAGLRRDRSGAVRADNRLLAKVSREEVAVRFMRPPPPEMLRGLVEDGLVTAEQAELARLVPMADDVTVEADSGGHTDRRPLTVLLPGVLALRERLAAETGHRVRVGAAGGIGTPEAAAAAFAMGAEYIVTGSVNQACVESGTSDAARRMLAEAGAADCDMAPAADMFELGVQLQVLRRGTLFPMRARRLYELYRTYDSVDDLPAVERTRLEQQIFRRPLTRVWQDTVDYFERRDPEQLARAADNPKRRMALIFRWYLGMGSRWAKTGDPDREPDYQVWCGPAMGAFNAWTSGTYLEQPGNRRVADVALHLMHGAAYTRRVGHLRDLGVHLPPTCTGYRPTRPHPRLSGVTA
jgi:PfaD family protein